MAATSKSWPLSTERKAKARAPTVERVCMGEEKEGEEEEGEEEEGEEEVGE